MKARDLLRILRAHGCDVRDAKGSHLVIHCGKCRTVVAVHAGSDIATGTLRAIERQLEPCLGKGWLR